MNYRSLLIACLAMLGIRQGQGWVVSALAGLAILCGARGAVADTECPYTWTVCSASSDCGSADTEGMYRYCTYGLDEDCNFYTVDCWDSSTPCSEADQGIAPAVLTRKIDCDNQNQWCGAGRDSTEPYRYCINYYKANGDVFGTEACECSATPCSEAEPETAIAFTGPTNACFNQKTDCDNQNQWCGAGRDSAEPYRYCTNYYNSEGNIFWRNCECSSTPCSEAEPDQMTAVQTSVDARPAQHRLCDAYPNPFNPAIVIPLDLATDEERVHLALYNVLGHRVRQLWHGPLGAGSHRFVWDGRDEKGEAVAAGVYIYKVEVDGQVEAKKTTKLP